MNINKRDSSVEQLCWYSASVLLVLLAIDTIFLLPERSIAEDKSNMQRKAAYTSFESHCLPNTPVLSKQSNTAQVTDLYRKPGRIVVYCFDHQEDMVSTRVMSRY